MEKSSTTDAATGDEREGPLPGAQLGPDGFVSYSRRDKERVLGLVAAAEQWGRDLWVDSDDIPAGLEWRGELSAGIENASAFIVCLSDHWLKSAECRRELVRALEVGKRLIPVVVGTLDVDRVPPELRSLQWIEARGVDSTAVAQRILQAIDVDHERVRSHTLWLGRALRWEASQRDPSTLLRGRDLRAAEDWLSTPGEPAPTALHSRFIVASRRRERRRLRGLLAAALVAVLVSTSLGVTAFWQRQEAIRQRNDARSRQLAGESLQQVDVDPERAVLLADAAWTSAHTEQAAGALRAAVAASRIRLRIQAHSDSVSGVGWAEDATRLVTSGRDGEARLWSARDGSAEKDLLAGHATPLTDLVEDGDGTSVAALSQSGEVFQWDLAAGSTDAPGRRVDHGASALAMSPDGRGLLIGHRDGSVRVISADGAERELELSDSKVTAAALAVDGSALVGTDDGTAYLIRPGRGPETVASYGSGVVLVQLSASGARALVASRTGEGAVVSLPAGGTTKRLRKVFDAALDGAGRYVATTDIDGRLFLDDLVAGKHRRLSAAGSLVGGLVLTRDGTLVAAGFLDGVVRVWRTSDGVEVTTMKGSTDAVSAVAFSPDGTQLATGHVSGAVRRWELPKDPQPVRLGRSVVAGSLVTDLALDPTSGQVAVAADPGLMALFALHDGRMTGSARSCLQDPSGSCLGSRIGGALGFQLSRVAFSPSGDRIAVGTRTGDLGIFDVSSAEQVSAAPGDSGYVNAIAFSTDGSKIVRATSAGLAVVDVVTGRILLHARRGDDIYGVAVMPDDRIVSVDNRGRVALSSFTDPGSARIADLEQAAFAIAVDPTGQRLAFGTESGEVRLTSADGATIASLMGHSGFVEDVEFNADGTLLTSAGYDGTVRVWDVGTTGPVVVFRPPGGPVMSLAVSQTGSTIAAGTLGAAYVLQCEICVDVATLVRMARQRVTRELTGAEKAQFLGG